MTANQTIRFGAWVKSARTSRGMTLEQLRNLTGLRHLSELERGERPNPSLGFAKKIAAAFGLPLWKVLKAINY